MHSKSDSIEVMITDKVDKVMEGFLNHSLIGIKKKFVLDYDHLLYFQCHKVNSNCIGSYINSPDWMKN